MDQSISSNLIPFFNAIQSIPNKNRGGCLFFCYVFWLWLLKTGLPTNSFQIKQYDYCGRISHNIKWINNQVQRDNMTPVESSHFTWLYEGVEYDGEGIVSPTRWVTYDSEILSGLNTSFVNFVDEFCTKALLHGDWNTDFYRNGAIEIINNNLDIQVTI